MKKGKLILLIVLAVLIALAIYLASTRKTKETIRPIFTVDSISVAGIEIADRDTSIAFSKASGRWRITQPINWDVEEGHFKLFLDEVIFEEYSVEPVAAGREAIEKYGLTEATALKIKAFDSKNKLIREVWFGDPGNPFDYFRFKGGSDVFQIRRKVCAFYGPKLESWRSPFALSLFPDQMLSIDVKHTKNTYKLSRNGIVWHYQDKQEDFDIPAGNETMGKILNSLTRLGSNSILTKEQAPAKLAAPVCEVTVMLTGNTTEKITFHPWEDKYLMTIGRFPDMYFVMLFDSVFRFTRHAAMFRAVAGLPETL
jgi:hypothetical protein